MDKQKSKRKVSDNHPFKIWAEAMKQAKQKLGIQKQFGCKKGSAVYKEAKKIHAKLKKDAGKK